MSNYNINNNAFGVKLRSTAQFQQSSQLQSNIFQQRSNQPSLPNIPLQQISSQYASQPIPPHRQTFSQQQPITNESEQAFFTSHNLMSLSSTSMNQLISANSQLDNPSQHSSTNNQSDDERRVSSASISSTNGSRAPPLPQSSPTAKQSSTQVPIINVPSTSQSPNNVYQQQSFNQNQPDPSSSQITSRRRLSDAIRSRQHESLVRAKKTFTAWSNTWLQKRQLHIDDIGIDYSDGVLLINLLELTFGTSIGRYNLQPKTPIHKLDNISLAFNFLKQQYSGEVLQLPDIHDIWNKIDKQILIVLSAMLRKLMVKGIVAGSDQMTLQTMSNKKTSNLRQHLLEWVRREIGHLIEINDFWQSFRNGIAFCLILNQICPGTIEGSNLNPSNSAANLQLAFNSAENILGIPSLLQVEDLILEPSQPDEESVINYVSILISASKALSHNKENIRAVMISKEENEKQLAQVNDELIRAKAEMTRIQLENEKYMLQLQSEKEREWQQLQSQQAEIAKKHQFELESNQLRIDEISQQLTAALENSSQYSADLHTALENEAKWRETSEKWRESSLKWKESAEVWKTNDEMKTQQINQLNQQHDTEIHNLNTIHSDELENQKRLFQAEIGLLTQKYENEINSFQSQLYNQYREYEEILDRFKAEQNKLISEERTIDASASPYKSRITSLQSQIKYNLTDLDLVQNMPIKSGNLWRRRPNALLHSNRWKVLQFFLRGDKLQYQKTNGGIKTLNLSDYYYVTTYQDELGELVLKLTSNVNESANLSFEFKACANNSDTVSNAHTTSWMFALNTRISLLNISSSFIKPNFRSSSLKVKSLSSKYIRYNLACYRVNILGSPI